MCNPPTYTLYIEKRNKNPVNFTQYIDVQRVSVLSERHSCSRACVIRQWWYGCYAEWSVYEKRSWCWMEKWLMLWIMLSHTETTRATHTISFTFSWQTILSCLLKKKHENHRGILILVSICVHIAFLQFYNEVCIYPRVTHFPSFLVIAILSQRVFKCNTCNFNNCNIINRNVSSMTAF